MNPTVRMSQKVDLKKQQVKDIVLTNYGLTVHALKKIRGILLLTTDRGRYSFKNAEELSDLDIVNYCLLMIRQNGFPFIPRLVPTLTGETKVRYEGENYYLDQWVEGNELPKGINYEEPLARALANFHRASQHLIIPADSERNGYGKRAAFLLSCENKLRVWSHQGAFISDFDKEALNFLNYRCRLAFSYIKHTPSHPSSVLPAICHGSLHHENIIIDSRNNIWFIDFESLVYAERMLDAAQLIHYYAYPLQWNPTVIHRLLNSYQAFHGTPISKDETRYFFSYLAFPRRLYNAMIKYFEDDTFSDKHYKKLQKVIQQEWAKEGFLRTYPL